MRYSLIRTPIALKTFHRKYFCLANFPKWPLTNTSPIQSQLCPLYEKKSIEWLEMDKKREIQYLSSLLASSLETPYSLHLSHENLRLRGNQEVKRSLKSLRAIFGGEKWVGLSANTCVDKGSRRVSARTYTGENEKTSQDRRKSGPGGFETLTTKNDFYAAEKCRPDSSANRNFSLISYLYSDKKGLCVRERRRGRAKL